MLRLYIPIALVLLWLGYLIYLFLVKKDRKRTLSFLYPGLLFIGIWLALFWWLR